MQIGFSFNDTATTDIYTLSLHDALPISLAANAVRRRHRARPLHRRGGRPPGTKRWPRRRSEEHTSELQSRRDLVCRLLLEKKKTIQQGESRRVTYSARVDRSAHSRRLGD